MTSTGRLILGAVPPGLAGLGRGLPFGVRMKTPVALTVLNNGVLACQKAAEDVKFDGCTGRAIWLRSTMPQLLEAADLVASASRRPGTIRRLVKEARSIAFAPLATVDV